MTATSDAGRPVLANRYQLDERVGAGSMGAVWRATDRLLNRTVAVKQLLLYPGAPGFDDRGYEEAKQRILREGRLAARLQHPHTISVFDVVLHDDAPWLVMEYLPSRTLSALLISEAPLDPRRVADIGRQIADGLTAAHAAGIVHRDIKPANVLISNDSGPDATVKITDFGVSRAADDVQLTRTGLIAGTPAYLAPEVARGQTPTPASDVFALGSTLYTAVEGEPPFGLDDNAYALLYKVGAGEIRPPERSGPLTDTLLRMLAKDPSQRPTAADARDELASLAVGWSAAQGDSAPEPRAGGRDALGKASGGDTKIDFSVHPDLAPIKPPVEPSVEQPVEPPPTEPAAPVPTQATADSPDQPPARTPVGAPRTPPRPPAPASARPPGPATRRRQGWLMWGALALVVVTAAAAAALSMPWNDGLLNSGILNGGTPSAAPENASPPPARVTGQPTSADLEGFVRYYYGLLPGRPDQAWALLGPTARGQSDSEDSYRGFYNGLNSVTFTQGPTAVDDRTVEATLRFEPRDGRTSTERFVFTVVPGPDGQLIMSSFRRVGIVG